MDFQSHVPVGNYNCFCVKKELKDPFYLKTGITTTPQHLRLLKGIQDYILAPERYAEMGLSHMAATFTAHTCFYTVKDFKYLWGSFTAQS